ncbi:hypothetical protein Tco_1142328 [Tanacetum coccineum]
MAEIVPSFNKEISLGIGGDRVTFDMDKKIHNFTALIGEIYMINATSNTSSDASSRVEETNDMHNKNNIVIQKAQDKVESTSLWHDQKSKEEERVNSFDTGQSFICVTKELMDALPMGTENGSRFRDMIRFLYMKNGIESPWFHFHVVVGDEVGLYIFAEVNSSIISRRGERRKQHSGRDQVSILAKDKGFGQEMHQSEEPKALYGVTSPKDYAVTYSNEEMSHHTLYGVKCLQDYAATFKYTRDDVSDSALRRNICDRGNVGSQRKCNHSIGNEMVRLARLSP